MTFELFDPNLDNSKRIWGVFAQDKFRTYAQRGRALQVATYHWRTKTYERLPDGTWKLLAIKDESNPPRNCTICGTRVHRLDTGARQYSDPGGHFVWQRNKGKIPDPPVMQYACKDCWPGVRYG